MTRTTVPRRDGIWGRAESERCIEIRHGDGIFEPAVAHWRGKGFAKWPNATRRIGAPACAGLCSGWTTLREYSLQRLNHLLAAAPESLGCANRASLRYAVRCVPPQVAERGARRRGVPVESSTAQEKAQELPM